MAKEELIELQGIVESVLPNAMFRVKISEKHTVTAVISGKMRQHKIQILEGDKVSIEVSQYDLNRGRVTFRHK